MPQPPFPMNKETFFRATCQFLFHENHYEAIRLILAIPDPPMEWEPDPEAGSPIDYWMFKFPVPIQTYVQMGAETRTSLEYQIRSAMNEVLSTTDYHQIGGISITKIIPEAEPDWRNKAKRALQGEGVTNQGRARSTNIAPLEHDGLLFRSHPEIKLYTALKALGITIAPLPVFIRGGRTYQRIEPDFVVVHKNTMMVIEVDGDGWHTETPVVAHDRLALLSREGVHTERVRASDCDTDAKATACAASLFAILERRAGMR